MTTYPAVPPRNDTDQVVIHQVVGVAPQRDPVAPIDASGLSAMCSREKDELADPESVGRNASGWSAGG